ncbi:zonular occludens toxin domain-containing protein [Paraglaciecola sp.]|uniref:zonular occludens toxin domain-containing protein n=1 Tax=Paraglaciecola sp. TaxID=1920173 RepID=UPI0030F42996
MAAVIFHGPPGSYKTSSAIWFEMLSAFRKGRIVVTNIEGMKPIDEIEKELGETFPESADIWRISTQKKKGLELFRSFFHWCPIGAQIIIDEVQDVFPAERTFKPEIYDYQPIEMYEGILPDEYIQKHLALLDDIKPDDFSKADYDDLGELVFDANNRIIYPTTLKESFMRHRKYNWDIVVCTPDITQVNTLIRGACESAFNHSSKDMMGKVIPYFARRPRIRQHSPKENGMAARKSDIVTYRKVPTDVHKLYKSTSTGKVSASGVGKSPLQSGSFIAAMSILAFILIYFINRFAFSSDIDKDNKAALAQAAQNGYSLPTKNLNENTRPVVGDSGRKGAAKDDVLLKLPYKPDDIYIVAVNTIYSKGEVNQIQMLFELVTKKGSVFLDESSIMRLGFTPRYITECMVNLITNEAVFTVFCSPDEQKPLTTERPESVREISIL